MFDFKGLQVARKKVVDKVKNEFKDFEKTLQDGLSLYEEFFKTNNTNTLLEAANLFSEALEIKLTDMRPYLFLSIIFHLFEKEDTALEYFNTAIKLSNNEYSEIIKDVEQIFFTA